MRVFNISPVTEKLIFEVLSDYDSNQDEVQEEIILSDDDNDYSDDSSCSNIESTKCYGCCSKFLELTMNEEIERQDQQIETSKQTKVDNIIAFTSTSKSPPSSPTSYRAVVNLPEQSNNNIFNNMYSKIKSIVHHPSSDDTKDEYELIPSNLNGEELSNDEDDEARPKQQYCNDCFRAAKNNKEIIKIIENQTKSFCKKLKKKMILKNTNSYLKNKKIKPQPYSKKLKNHFKMELEKLFNLYDDSFFVCKCNNLD
ncbi:hypothetical protein TONV_072 [Tipula oleracea nudivirus]|uniref:Uncharacterized protein n=1 Tax=Tipula oleracea nudivirus TaxID=1546257 RepID=A0A0B4VFV2_9VIRU|nr:hypothetical protein TONV_072 [Tipula oleracea nudivirus]AJD20132.1 hypothetical protein TONV_072 [Tipula oleracea nudivirus]